MSDAVDWAERYESKDTPWDVGGPHPEVAARFQDGPTSGRMLVPGCGFGHDALHFAALGMEVTALDLVPALEAEVGRKLALAGGKFVCADAFAWEPPERFDHVFEHTFLCALPPESRSDWASFMARVLKPGGKLYAIAFPIGKPAESGGPPYGYDISVLESLLAGDFRVLSSEPAGKTLARRDWEEHWVVAERLG